MALHTYIPQDRLRALVRGLALPERTHGTALFADISGFTTLTENLARSLGARRGIEVLSQHEHEHAPEHIDALTLLDSVLDLVLPDTDFTRALQPQDRKGLLEITVRHWASCPG